MLLLFYLGVVTDDGKWEPVVLSPHMLLALLATLPNGSPPSHYPSARLVNEAWEW